MALYLPEMAVTTAVTQLTGQTDVHTLHCAVCFGSVCIDGGVFFAALWQHEVN